MSSRNWKWEVTYKGLIVGRHRLDVFVEDEVVVELKAIGGLAEIHLAVRKSRAPIGV
jgi:GxxExxY protein